MTGIRRHAAASREPSVPDTAGVREVQRGRR